MEITKDILSKIIKESVAEVMVESGLSRVMHHIMEHQCAIITAWRTNPFDRSLCVGKEFSEEELESFENNPKKANKINNRNLKAYLLNNGYGITNINGSYIENFETPSAREVAEESLFVVNIKDDPDFVSKIKLAGEKYCQDSVLIIELGGENSYLLGTNNNEFPGHGAKVSQGGVKLGLSGEFMSRVKGRPFKFTNEQINSSKELEVYTRLPRLQRLCVNTIAKNFF